MPETHSRAGKRVEEIVVTDEPHERYRMFNQWTGEKLDNGIPVLKSVKGKEVLEKDKEYHIVNCPECIIPAKYDNDEEPVCPDCGMICKGENRLLEERFAEGTEADQTKTTETADAD